VTDPISEVFRSVPLRRLCRKYIKGPEWEDVYQDAFLKIANLDKAKLTNIISNNCLKSYAFLVVRNTCLDHFKKKEPDFVEVNNELLESDLADFTALKDLEENIENIHWYHRELLNLYIEHKSYRKIEALTKIPYKSVSNGVKKARQMLNLTR